MSTVTETEPEAIALVEFAAAASCEGGPPVRRDLPRQDWVLVNQQGHVVVAFPSLSEARAALNGRIDDDAAALSLRLLRLVDGRCEYQDWPRQGTPAERACEMAQEIASRTDAGLAAYARRYYLRGQVGRLRLAGELRRVLHLWWFRPDGSREPVGMLIENGDDTWEALVDTRARGLTPEDVDGRIAEAMNEFMLGGECDADVVESVRNLRDAGHDHTNNVAQLVIMFALDVLAGLNVIQATEAGQDD